MRGDAVLDLLPGKPDACSDDKHSTKKGGNWRHLAKKEERISGGNHRFAFADDGNMQRSGFRDAGIVDAGGDDCE